MQPTLFLSDLHLSPDRPAAAAAFEAFCAGPARAAAAVYVLGDLYDWWIGDDQLDDPFAARIAVALRTVTGAGVRVHVMQGNRDFLYGPRFERDTGASLLPEQLVIDVNGVPTVLLHGDELCTSDLDYQRYRARMRTAETRRRLLALPAFVRRWIARSLRRKSRDQAVQKPESILDVAEDAVVAMFRALGVARMIHGHTHRPATHRVDVDGRLCERIVLADWHDRGHWLEAGAEGLVRRDIT
jgi:UDP-2,3-diacylglucosamine hydrolase